MIQSKSFKEHLPTLKEGDSVFFETPVFVTGGSGLFCGKTRVVAQFRGGMLSFADDDSYFNGRPRMIPVCKIREDQQVITSSR